MLSSELASNLLTSGMAKALVLQANGRSMFPAVVKGDRVHLVRVENNAAQVGDILFCRGVSGRFYIHRLVSLSPAPRTRGDALAQEDEEIAEILAKVSRVEKTWRSRLRRITLRLRKLYG